MAREKLLWSYLWQSNEQKGFCKTLESLAVTAIATRCRYLEDITYPHPLPVQLHEGLCHESRELRLQQVLGVLKTQEVGQLQSHSTVDRHKSVLGSHAIESILIQLCAQPRGLSHTECLLASCDRQSRHNNMRVS